MCMMNINVSYRIDDHIHRKWDQGYDLVLDAKYEND